MNEDQLYENMDRMNEEIYNLEQELNNLKSGSYKQLTKEKGYYLGTNEYGQIALFENIEFANHDEDFYRLTIPETTLQTNSKEDLDKKIVGLMERYEWRKIGYTTLIRVKNSSLISPELWTRVQERDE